jgi:hypothetical protein
VVIPYLTDRILKTYAQHSIIQSSIEIFLARQIAQALKLPLPLTHFCIYISRRPIAFVSCLLLPLKVLSPEELSSSFCLAACPHASFLLG